MLNIIPGVPLDSGVFTIAYITTSLFDCDTSNIEYVETSNNGIEPFYIFRTDGTQLFSKDSAIGPYNFGNYDGSIITKPIINTPLGAKLILGSFYSNDWSIYSLCGTLPQTIDEFENGNQYVQIYPNPSSRNIIFEIAAPSNIENYELTIYDALLQFVRKESIKGRQKIILDNETLSSGPYYFSLQTKNKIIQAGKFIISK
jgi:hypothetical protein